jgi:hypothetical protein
MLLILWHFTHPPMCSTVLEEFPEGRILLQLVDACVAQRLQLWGDAGAAQAAALMGDTSNRSQVLRERFAFGTRVSVRHTG